MSIQFESEGTNAPFPMPDQKDTHKAWKSKGVGYKLKRVFHQEQTNVNYVDSLVFDARLHSRMGFQIINKGAQSVYWKILGCFDPSYWEEVQSETSVAAGAKDSATTTQPYLWFKLQVKSNSGASLVEAFIGGKTP